MNFFRNNIGTVLVAFLLYEPIFGDITCRMRLNDDCPARVWQDQYRCIMAQNTLSMIMDCITVRQDSSENLRCRPQDNNFDVGEEIYERRVINGVLNLCIIPRAVLIHGPPTLPRYWPASMAGALKACPAHDPRFLICLCSLNVHPEQMVEFAQNFMSDKNQVFGCRRQAPAPKVPRELLELPMYNSSIMESRLEKRNGMAFQYIDIQGRPVFENGYVGYPVPYYDQGLVIGGRDVGKRCYMHPEQPVIARCTSWYLPTRTALAVALPTAAPEYASYTREYTSLDEPTASEAPEIASVTNVAAITAGSANNGISSATTGPFAPANTTPSSGAKSQTFALSDSIIVIASLLITYILLF